MRSTKARLEFHKHENWDKEPTRRGRRCGKCRYLALGRGLIYFDGQLYALTMCFNCGWAEYKKSEYKPSPSELKMLR